MYDGPRKLDHGLEETPTEYIDNLLDIIAEVQRVLKPTGSFWLNIGNAYHRKNLVGIPWRVALAMKTLCRMRILTMCPEGGIVLDPFAGTGTTNLVAFCLGRKSIGIDVSGEYLRSAQERCKLLLHDMNKVAHQRSRGVAHA